jgi:transposase InsO family protein
LEFDKTIKANPGAKPLFHSDRGYQYTSKIFKPKLDAIGATQSMSRVDRCIDNGPMVGFWGTLKSEMYYLKELHSIEELEKAIDEYLEITIIKNLTPIEYLNQALVSYNILFFTLST